MISDLINKEKPNKIFPEINVCAEMYFVYIAKAESWFFFSKVYPKWENNRQCWSRQKRLWELWKGETKAKMSQFGKRLSETI